MEYKMRFCSLLVACFAFFAGCQAGVSESAPYYAELRIAENQRMQVLIKADQWGGLITPDGPGPGWVHNLHYWVTLSGPGPTFVDPKFNVNSIIEYKYIGTITVDREKKQVMIDLKRVVTKPGEPEKLEPSPANGTYLIKKVTQEAFMKPE